MLHRALLRNTKWLNILTRNLIWAYQLSPFETPESIDRTLSTNEDLSLLLAKDLPKVREQIFDL